MNLIKWIYFDVKYDNITDLEKLEAKMFQWLRVDKDIKVTCGHGR